MLNNSIVMQLQKDASSQDVSLVSLLRKALLIAHKLKIVDFDKWLTKELKGYSATVSIPQYRLAHGFLRVINPYHGHQPYLIEDPQFEELVTRIEFRQPISEIEQLISQRSSSELLMVKLSGEQATNLAKIANCPYEIQKCVQNTLLHRICDQVKTIILEWSLKLQEQGILGENMIFSAKETDKAKDNITINIGSFHGTLSNNSTIDQSLNIFVEKGNKDTLTKLLKEYGREDSEIKKLIIAINEDPQPTISQKLGKNVSHWLGKILGKCAEGAYKLTVEIASTVLTQAIQKYYGI